MNTASVDSIKTDQSQIRRHGGEQGLDQASDILHNSVYCLDDGKLAKKIISVRMYKCKYLCWPAKITCYTDRVLGQAQWLLSAP